MENNILEGLFEQTPIFSLSSEQNFLSNCAGEGKSGIIIFCHSNEKNPAALEFLGKVLAAVQKDLHQDAFLAFPVAPFPANWFSELRKKSIVKVMIFVNQSDDYGFNFSFKKYASFLLGDIQFLFADTLTRLASDKNLKADLWKCMKQLFPNHLAN